MRRNRKNSIKKERVIMIASSAFVLAALTMTGLYMKEQNVESKDDGYTLDFTTLESSADDKMDEIAQNVQLGEELAQNQVNNDTMGGDSAIQPEVVEGELDYMPLEVGSGDIEIPGLTGEIADTNLLEEDVDLAAVEDADSQLAAADGELTVDGAEDAGVAVAAEDVVVEKALSFSEDAGLLRPISGEIMMHYSMDSSIYFATLDQYKYNPAVMLSAIEGTQVRSCADAKVVSVYEDAKIGNAVTLDLGNGYQATYGQLKDIVVEEGDYVGEGDVLGAVAAPTKYYSVEGCNLYFALTKDGTPVNPEVLFK